MLDRVGCLACRHPMFYHWNHILSSLTLPKMISEHRVKGKLLGVVLQPSLPKK